MKREADQESVSAQFADALKRHKARQRRYMRVKRNAEWRNVFEAEAERRGLTSAQLEKQVLEIVASDNLFTAILDK